MNKVFEKSITITAIEHDVPQQSRAGGTYTVSRYTHVDGQLLRTTTIPSYLLHQNGIKTQLGCEVYAIVANCAYTIVLRKDDRYWDHVSVRPYSPDDTYEARCGNNTTTNTDGFV